MTHAVVKLRLFLATSRVFPTGWNKYACAGIAGRRHAWCHQPRRQLSKNAAAIAERVKSGMLAKVVVMCGAGISTPSGLPDFRTPGSGLYESAKLFNLPDPTAVFDIDYFQSDPRPFFAVAQDLYPGKYKPNMCHYFLTLLHKKCILRRVYTQNIDGLERIAGVPEDLLVEAHGTFATATCRGCGEKYTGEEIRATIFAGDIPTCKKCKGVIKPDIVFFGEDLPQAFYNFMRDFGETDLLVVMGTSLEVYPFAGLVEMTKPGVNRLLVNKEKVGPFKTNRSSDASIEGDIVEGVKALTEHLGWSEELQALSEASPQP